jgi:hypothetical protein
MPDPARFTAALGSSFPKWRKVATVCGSTGRWLRSCQTTGNVIAAIELEDLWNDFTTRYQFLLLRVYPIRAFDTAARAEPF